MFKHSLYCTDIQFNIQNRMHFKWGLNNLIEYTSSKENID